MKLAQTKDGRICFSVAMYKAHWVEDASSWDSVHKGHLHIRLDDGGMRYEFDILDKALLASLELIESLKEQ